MKHLSLSVVIFALHLVLIAFLATTSITKPQFSKPIAVCEKQLIHTPAPIVKTVEPQTKASPQPNVTKPLPEQKKTEPQIKKTEPQIKKTAPVTKTPTPVATPKVEPKPVAKKNPPPEKQPSKPEPVSQSSSSSQKAKMIAALNQNLENFSHHKKTTPNTSTSSMPTPLQLKSTPGSKNSQASIEAFLAQSIILPEYGDVKLKFRLTEKGSIENLEFISGSIANQTYLKKIFEQLQIPAYLYCGAEEFQITLKSRFSH